MARAVSRRRPAGSSSANTARGPVSLNVPKATITTAGGTAVADLVLEIDPKSEQITNTLNLTQKSSPADGCATTTGSPPVNTAVGITGMALGPDHQIAIACGTSGKGSVVITEDFVHLYSLAGQTGADEIWYNPGDNHYFYATVFKAATPRDRRPDNTWRG
jgi:hypothetical protein